MGKTTMILSFVAMLSSSMMLYSAKESGLKAERRQADYQKELIVEEIARVGYNLGLGAIKRDFEAYTTLSKTVDYHGGSYQLTVTGSGRRVKISSKGVYGAKDHTIEGKAQLIYPLPSPLYMHTQTVSAKYNGDIFEISGIDADPYSGLPEPPLADTVAAVVTSQASVRDEMLDELRILQSDNVHGKKASGDIYKGKSAVNLKKLIQESRDNADAVFYGDQNFSENPSFGSSSDPQIIVVEGGDVRLRGNISGYGVLLVQGNVDVGVTGSLTWEGIVIVYGDNGATVDINGNAHISGALVAISEQFGESDADDVIDFRVGGSAVIEYNSEAIMRMEPKLENIKEGKQTKLLSERMF